MTIKSTLDQRGSRYGTFEDNAKITQSLYKIIESAPSFYKLEKEHKEAFHMIFHKIARAVCGDPDYIDNIHDIVGYATLLENYLIKKSKEKQGTKFTILKDLEDEVQMLKNAASGKLGEKVDLTGLVSDEAIEIFIKGLLGEIS